MKRKTQNAKRETTRPSLLAIGDWSSIIGYGVLAGLLLVLALRLTMSEEVRETLDQKAARLESSAAEEQPFVGPAVTTGFSGATLLLAAGAALLAARRGGHSRSCMGKLVLTGGIMAWGVMSALHAANRAAAMDGLSDLAMALAAAWAVSALCADDVLGDRGRRVVIAALAAILVVWVAKGFYQKLVDIPDLLEYFRTHRDDALRSQGIGNDPVKVQLFESRLRSGEVTGYIALSNALAAGLAGLLAVMTGLVMGRVVEGKHETQDTKHETRNTKQGAGMAAEIPLGWMCAGMGGLAVMLGLCVLIWTRSKGGTAVGTACVGAIIAGMLGWRWVVAYRRLYLAAALALAVLGAAGVVSYGLIHDALPTKSLLFRWHYWTASVPIIRDSPLVGVGLNNFGDYYTAFKRPSSPEDVKDPHGFLVRLAAETGLPGAAMVGALVLWMLLRGLRSVPHPTATTVSGRSIMDDWLFLVPLGAVASIIWWTLHLALAEVPNLYSAYLSVIAAVLAAGGWVLGLYLAHDLGPRGLRCVAVAAAVGAAGMLVYDQVNMALVTGPVAMLFWVLLGLGDSYEPVRDNRSARTTAASWATYAAGILPAAAGLVLIFGVSVPLANGTAVWDPATYEWQALRAERAGQDRQALAAINRAIELAPRGADLLLNRITLERTRLHEPVAADIRRMLQLDRANARIRITLAMPDSDLPPAERAAILEEALRLDLQLPPDEFKRLSMDERAALEEKIRQLRR